MMATFFSLIYFLLFMAASMVPQSGGYMLPYALLWKHGLSDVEDANVTMSSTPPPREATWPTSTIPQDEIEATTATPGLTGIYPVLVVVMMTLALCILRNVNAGALVRVMQNTMRLNEATSTREASIASLTSEVNLLKEQLAAVSSEASDIRGQLIQARVMADQATDALTIERQSRRQAETRVEDERRERVSTAANAQTMHRRYWHQIEELRALRARQEADSELRIENLMNENDRLKEAIVVGGNHKRQLQARVRSLMASLEDAQTSSELLQDLRRAKAAIDNRLEAVTQEKASLVEESSLKISELERKVAEGETRMRLMHNTIQELRGNVPEFTRVRPFLPSDEVPDDAEPVVVNTADSEGCILSTHDFDAGNVRVFTRVRPFLPSDKVPDDAEPVVVNTADKQGCILSTHVFDAGKDYGHVTHSFKFDRCFPPSAGQEEVFAEVSEFVQSALDGFNVCLFSYGSNGSGKTHTMQGSGAGSMRGIIPRAMEQVGKYKETLEEQGWQYEMEVSFLEIYNETIQDLLRGDSSGQDIKHEIKRDRRGNTTVTGITKEAVDPKNSTHINEIIQRAACRRSVAQTDMNEQSSRSHSVFTLYLKATNNSQRSELRGSLHLVDLAGSERVGRSNASGDRLNETKAINTSLTALGIVFKAIGNKSSHIPFRNSKLTYLLQPALSRNGKTLMMVNLSPARESFNETLCSLRFAEQVKQCNLGKPKRNLHYTGSS